MDDNRQKRPNEDPILTFHTRDYRQFIEEIIEKSMVIKTLKQQTRYYF